MYAIRSYYANYRGSDRFRMWSAASSSGEEAYTMAMLLADKLPTVPWEIIGSDISTQVLDKARAGHYSLERSEGIPRITSYNVCYTKLLRDPGRTGCRTRLATPRRA